MTVDCQEFYKVQDICRSLMVTPRTVRRWISEGLLPAVKCGRDWRIKGVDFMNFTLPQRGRGE